MKISFDKIKLYAIIITIFFIATIIYLGRSVMQEYCTGEKSKCLEEGSMKTLENIRSQIQTRQKPIMITMQDGKGNLVCDVVK